MIGYPTPANMAGSRRKSVIWDTIDCPGGPLNLNSDLRHRTMLRQGIRMSYCSTFVIPALVTTTDVGLR